MKTFASALAGPATTVSSVGGVGYFALHAASSLMSVGRLRGAVPVNLTFPVLLHPLREASDAAAGAVAGPAGGARETALSSALVESVSEKIPPPPVKAPP